MNPPGPPTPTSATTTLDVTVPAGNSSTSVTAQNDGVTVQTYQLAWDATSQGTNGQDDLDGRSSFFTNGEVLGQLHATETENMASVNLSGTVSGLDSGASVSIQENGSNVGAGSMSGSTWSGSAELSGAGQHTLTIIVSGIDTVAGGPATATTTITVEVTSSPPTITYSATTPSSYISVASNGVITVTDADALEAAADGGGVTLGVQATDGTNTVQSQFAMWLGVFGPVQSAIWMEDNGGTIYQPTTAADLIADIQAIQARGRYINTLIIKGHGSGDAISVGTGDDWLTCVNGSIYLKDQDITALLSSTTDAASNIYLRGCFSHALAKKMEDTRFGANVYGAVRFVIGIPGTCWGLGSYQ